MLSPRIVLARFLVTILAMWMEHCFKCSAWCSTRFAVFALIWFGCLYNARCWLYNKWYVNQNGKLHKSDSLILIFIFNTDMWDKDIDAKVERTKSRPLVSGEITQWDALVFLSGQLGVGLIVLLQLNWYSILLGASSLGIYQNTAQFQ
jgi:hypothetical protein